jgi:multiple sugar transport system permease protein
MATLNRTISTARTQRDTAGIWKIVRTTLLYALMIGLGLLAIFPFLWMISTSLKDAGAVLIWPPQLLPPTPQWHNYTDVLEAMPFGRFFLNTIGYTIAVTVGQLVFCSLAGFGFARLKFPGRNTLFLLYLATMMIPATVTLIPGFILMRWVQWTNTIWAMTIPGMLGSAFGTFLMRQFFLTIPKELDEAAVVEGANKFQVFWHVDLPLARSALIVLTVFTILAVWNDFLWPLIMLRDEELYTVTLGLARFGGPGWQAYTNWPQLMAASTMTVMPLIFIFLIAQRYFIKGIAVTGLSGR